jgi:PilZ domain-containing protein
VRLATQTDRRRELRFPQSLEMTVQALPELGSSRKLKIVPLRGRIQNISEGGVCLITSRPIERFSVLRCELTIGDVPLRIATLMEVRWTKKQDPDPETHLSGLEFLL